MFDATKPLPVEEASVMTSTYAGFTPTILTYQQQTMNDFLDSIEIYLDTGMHAQESKTSRN